jgi:hypothetical protein
MDKGALRRRLPRTGYRADRIHGLGIILVVSREKLRIAD